MRRQLVLVALAISSMVAIAFAVPLALLVRDVARDRALTAAEQDAAALAPVLALTSESDALSAAIRGTISGGEGRMAVVFGDGRLVGDDRPAGDAVELSRSEGLAFSRTVPGGVEVLTPVLTGGDDPAVIRVFVPEGDLDEGVVNAWLALGGVALVLVALAVAVADRLARAVTRPATELAAVARRLGAGELDARAEPAGPPEIQDVTASVNHLAGRIQELIGSERERIADLSHRLRTPLTSLRMHLEAGQLDQARDDADRLEREVTAAIHRARGPLDAVQRSDMVSIVEDRAAFFGALADDQGRDWVLHLPDEAVWIELAADEATAAVDAVLGNVFAHTADDDAYRIRLERTGQVAVLAIEDAGPGLDPSAVARGATGGDSTGLGLDIARQAARRAGGSLTVGRSSLGGASVTIEWPVPESAGAP